MTGARNLKALEINHANIGVLENLGGGYIHDLIGLKGMGPVAPFFVLVAILWVRPTGLFGRKEIERV